MKRMVILAMVLAMVFGTMLTANADIVNLYLDTAPNGGAAFTAFRDAAFANIVNNTFVNQAHSFNLSNQGTLNYNVEDYMVYSWPNGGNRLHSFYWVPNTNIAQLTAQNFQVSIEYNYGGTWYNPYEAYNLGTWVTPGSWINYQGGVIGTIGNALWGAYGYNSATPEALAALATDLQDARDYLGNTKFMARLDGVTYTLTAEHTPNVPLPSTVLLLGSGLAGLAFYRRRWAIGRKD